MDRKSGRLYPSAPLEKADLEQRLGKKLNDVNSFKNHINNINEMTTYFKDKTHKQKKRYKNNETLNTLLESVDTIVIMRATSTSIILSITGTGLILLPFSAGSACTLSLCNKVLHKLIMNKDSNYKIQFERDHKQVTVLINYAKTFTR